jgi:hypothetical protein
MWTPRGIRRGFERGRCPYVWGRRTLSTYLKNTLKGRSRQKNLYAVNEDIAYRKIIRCTNLTKINTAGKHLFKTKCKWRLPQMLVVSWNIKTAEIAMV